MFYYNFWDGIWCNLICFIKIDLKIVRKKTKCLWKECVLEIKMFMILLPIKLYYKLDYLTQLLVE